MRPYRIIRLIASALVAISAMLASVGIPPRITRAAAPLCGTLIQNVSGAIAANTVWTPANIYVLTGDLTVNTGVTLVIQPGTVIKVLPDFRLFIDGTLTANGTLANPIYVTSYQDDTLCGDTNADGSNSQPTSQDWGYIEFTPSSNDASSLTRAVLRYGGLSRRQSPNIYSGIIRLNDAGPTLANLSMEQNYRNAAQLVASTWNASTLASTTVIYWFAGDGDLRVATGQTLTLAPGVKVKAGTDARMYIDGKLTANGTPSAPIYFTSEKDDTVCGYGASDELVCDTNNAVDGPAPQDWGYIEFTPGSNDTSSLTRAVLRYSGLSRRNSPYSYGAAVRLNDAAPTLAYLTLEQNLHNAAQLVASAWNANTLSSTTVVYWFAGDGDLRVATGQTLTLAPGVKVKAGTDARIFIDGKLIADGAAATDVTPAMPITFTSEKDDSVCGVGASNEQVCDTNNAVDGPAINDWGYIEFSPGSNSTSSLSRAVLRYGGLSRRNSPNVYSGAIRLNGATPTIAYNSLQQNYVGIDLLGGTQPTLTCNDFVGNQAFGMRNNQPTTVVSATLQWWNSASGPTHSANVGGTGEKISDGIAYSPWANTACAPTVTVTTTPWLVLL